PADLRIALLNAIPGSRLDGEEAHVARPDYRRRMFPRRRDYRGEDEVDLAPGKDPVAREAGRGQCIPDGPACLGGLIPKQSRRRGDVLVEEAEYDLVFHAQPLSRPPSLSKAEP